MSKQIDIATILKNPPMDVEVTVKGWVRAFRANRFIALFDGSTFKTIQVVVDFENTAEEVLKQINFHACVEVRGKLVASQGSGQSVRHFSRVYLTHTYSMNHRELNTCKNPHTPMRQLLL